MLQPARFSYQLFQLSDELARPLGAPRRLASCLIDPPNRTVTHKDGVSETSKGLDLPEGFRVVFPVTCHHLAGMGFALYGREFPKGFGWEWFDPDEPRSLSERLSALRGSILRKLQGDGRILQRFKHHDSHWDIVEIRLLDDVALRFCLDISTFVPGSHTHEIRVRRNSRITVSSCEPEPNSA